MAHKLPVMEHFYTLQGEGAFAGQAAYFIRLGGCDVGCHWCDVKESWPMEGHKSYTVNEIVELVIASKAPIAVITGGEPLMHNLNELTTALKSNQIRTHIETSGAYLLTGVWDWICFSPKKFKPPMPEFYEIAHELKCIIFNSSDFSFAENEKSKIVAPTVKFYLQAEWDKRDKIYPMLIEYIKTHPEWAISVQTHKYLNIP